MKDTLTFKVATIKNSRDGEPKVCAFTINELIELISNGHIETADGWVRVGDIRSKVSDVSCPVHGDSNGSEFASYNLKSDNVFLRCKHCGTVWADKYTEDESTLILPWKRKPVSLPKKDANTSSALDSFVFDSAKTLELNERYLPSDLMLAVPETGVTLIKSPKGTGKTTVLAPLVAEAKRHRGKGSSTNYYEAGDGSTYVVSKLGEQTQSVLLIGHRVNLLRELSARLELDYYLDLEDGQTSPYLAICMDSLTRFDPLNDNARDTIIIDESEQVFKHLASDTLKGRRTEVFNSLIWLLRSAKRVILLDADLTSDMTLEMILMLRGRQKVASEPYLGVVNKYVFEGRETFVYESWHHLLAEAVDAARNGGRVFFSTNYRESGADVFARIFEQLGKKVLLVSSRTTITDPQVIQFMGNTTEESKKYDVIVCTPTVQTGVSIDNDHFTHVYGVFWNNVGTFQDIDQALSRVRRVNTHRVWIQEVEHKSLLKTEQEIYEEVQRTEQSGSRKIIYGEDTGIRLTKGERLWAEIYSRIEYLSQTWSRHKLQQFIDLRTETGYMMDARMCDPAMMKLGKDLYNTAANMPTETLAAELWQTSDIDVEEFDRLEKKRNRSHEEYLKLERARYKRALKSDWMFDTLERAVAQDLLRLTHRLDQLLNWSFESRIAYDEASRKKNNVTFTDAAHLTMKAGLYEALCTSLGMPLASLVKHAREASAGNLPEVEIKREQLYEMAKCFDSHKKEFSRYLKCRIKDPTNEKNLKKVWDVTLGVFLPLTKRKLGARGAQVTRYFINWERVDLVLKYFVFE